MEQIEKPFVKEIPVSVRPLVSRQQIMEVLEAIQEYLETNSEIEDLTQSPGLLEYLYSRANDQQTGSVQ